MQVNSSENVGRLPTAPTTATSTAAAAAAATPATAAAAAIAAAAAGRHFLLCGARDNRRNASEA